MNLVPSVESVIDVDWAAKCRFPLGHNLFHVSKNTSNFLFDRPWSEVKVKGYMKRQLKKTRYQSRLQWVGRVVKSLLRHHQGQVWPNKMPSRSSVIQQNVVKVKCDPMKCRQVQVWSNELPSGLSVIQRNAVKVKCDPMKCRQGQVWSNKMLSRSSVIQWNAIKVKCDPTKCRQG